MSNLSNWLRAEFDARTLTQTQVSMRSSVSRALISEMLNKDHVSRVEFFFRLADFFAVSSKQVLRFVG